MPVDTELQESINQAAEQITGKKVADIVKDNPKVVPDTETEVDETPADEESDTETQVEESEAAAGDELSDDEVAEARRLYKILKDPQEGAALVAAMAQRAGLFANGNQPTKTEVKAVKKDIQSIFEESLGPQYKFLAPNLSKAIDAILVQERETQQAQLFEVQQTQIVGEIDKTLGSLAKETNGVSRQFENKMADLMKEYPIGPAGNVDKYIRDIFVLASAGKVKQTVAKNLSDKVRRNANNVADRIGQRGGQPGAETLPGKKMNLKEAIAFAQKQLESRAGKK